MVARLWMARPVVLTDLDNTIYNWVDFFAPSFRAMVHVLSREMGVGEEVIYDDFKRVYRENRSVEYSFSVQKLQICEGKSVEEIADLVRVAKGAFSRVRQKNLRPYKGVQETLTWAREKGIRVVGVTNSSRVQAERRLRQLRLDGFFYGLAGWEGHEVPEDLPLTKRIKQQAEQGRYDTPHIKVRWHLREGQLKPSPKGYLQIISELGVSPKDTFIIGDSLHKDVAPALEIGAVGIWAKYGGQVDPKNFETLLRITHWQEEEIEVVYDKDSITPSFEIDEFSELMRVVLPVQLGIPGL